MTYPRHKSVETWLLFMMFLVVAIIVVGGATRLTNSGLSITEWAPIRGMLPPLSEESWLAEFEKYKRIPEFSAEHPDMNMSGFKFVFILPFLWFLSRGKLAVGHRWKFLVVALLIGLQGFIGWWMVSSGLQEGQVDVSQYRLAIHLGMAFIILGFLYWLYKRQSSGWEQQAAYPHGRG